MSENWGGGGGGGRRHRGYFPGGSVVKNPLTNTGDTGLIPGMGRSHMLQEGFHLP